MRILRLAALTLCLLVFGAALAAAQGPPPQQQDGRTFAPNELINEGHRFFGTVSRGLAQVVEKAVSHWGQPNGYILGQEGSGAFVVGLRYGDGNALHQECRRPAGVLGRPVDRLRHRRRRRPHHDAGL